MGRHAALPRSIQWRIFLLKRMHFLLIYIASMMKLQQFRFRRLSNGSHKRYNHIERQPKNSLCNEKEAQLPQRNSASAAHVYLGWLTDCAMHWTPQNRRCCTTRLLSNHIESAWSGKLLILADSLQFVLSYALNSRQISYKPLLFRNYSSLTTFLSLTCKARPCSFSHAWSALKASACQACCSLSAV